MQVVIYLYLFEVTLSVFDVEVVVVVFLLNQKAFQYCYHHPGTSDSNYYWVFSPQNELSISLSQIYSPVVGWTASIVCLWMLSSVRSGVIIRNHLCLPCERPAVWDVTIFVSHKFCSCSLLLRHKGCAIFWNIWARFKPATGHNFDRNSTIT